MFNISESLIPNTWSLFNPTQVIFGPNTLRKLAQLCPEERIGLITTAGAQHRGLVRQISALLGERLVQVFDRVRPNPDYESLIAAAAEMREARPKCLVALGGGSAIDTAKVIARLLGGPEGASLSGYLAHDVVLGSVAAIPMIAIPTTAGTGAEVTPFATVWDLTNGRKYSLVGDDLYPRTAIVDPLLTQGLPWRITVASGLDTVAHALESTWNRNATPITLGLAVQSLSFAIPALLKLRQSPNDSNARYDMMQASLLAGLAISQTRTALAHSISYPLTARLGLEHGFAVAFTLPEILRFNIPVDDGRVSRLANELGYRSGSEFADDLERIFIELELKEFIGSVVPNSSEVFSLLGEMLNPERADNNLRKVCYDDLTDIIRHALEAFHAS